VESRGAIPPRFEHPRSVRTPAVPVLATGKNTKPASPGGGPDDLKRILHLQVPVIVKLAERTLTLSEVMRLGTGAIIEFFKSSDEPLELMINNKAIALGEAVKVGENFGLKITQIGDVKALIRSMGDRT
jgi:flagellar motor switch protein FliN/FliY